ncbi:MAG TPA: hypothetical protein VLC09_15990 [Polyangiaceae bacterium]|nr:hypothetical protein [Polyangiaceae bacterium]
MTNLPTTPDDPNETGDTAVPGGTAEPIPASSGEPGSASSEEPASSGEPDSADGSVEPPGAESAGAQVSTEPSATDSAAAAKEEETVTLADGWKAFRSWSLRTRLTFVLATAFVLLHVTAVLVRGAPKKWREPLNPLVAWYGEGLRMTDTWGMFSLPPKDKLVSVIGIKENGDRIEISHVQQNERDFLQRIRDTRLRKIQTKLADEKSRNHWGWGYVKYFCKDALERGIPLRRIQLEVRVGDAEKTEVYLAQSCRQPVVHRGGVR